MYLFVHVEMCVHSKIHTAFSHVGKANTYEPSLAPLHLSMYAAIRCTSICIQGLKLSNID